MCGVQRQCCSHCRIAHPARIDASNLKTDAHRQTCFRSLAHDMQVPKFVPSPARLVLGMTITITYQISKSYIIARSTRSTRSVPGDGEPAAAAGARPAGELACPVLEPTCTSYITNFLNPKTHVFIHVCRRWRTSCCSLRSVPTAGAQAGTPHDVNKMQSHIHVHSVLSPVQALVNQLLRLALCSYRPARELARPVLERALKRYVSLAPAALPPVLLALSGALSGSSSAASAGTGADSANGTADGGGTGAAAASGVQAAGSRKEVALAEDGVTEALLRRLLAEMRVGGEVAPAGEV